jgi:hypothetical protein
LFFADGIYRGPTVAHPLRTLALGSTHRLLAYGRSASFRGRHKFVGHHFFVFYVMVTIIPDRCDTQLE